MLKGKTVILGVTGSIAAYKIADLASKLSKLHCDVHVIMTKNATNFIHPITFETLTNHRCLVDTFDRNFEYNVEHVSLAKKADVVLVAPATANVIAKMAHGIADDMLTTTVLACNCKKIVAPAMNTRMFLLAAGVMLVFNAITSTGRTGLSLYMISKVVSEDEAKEASGEKQAVETNDASDETEDKEKTEDAAAADDAAAETKDSEDAAPTDEAAAETKDSEDAAAKDDAAAETKDSEDAAATDDSAAETKDSENAAAETKDSETTVSEEEQQEIDVAALRADMAKLGLTVSDLRLLSVAYIIMALFMAVVGFLCARLSNRVKKSGLIFKAVIALAVAEVAMAALLMVKNLFSPFSALYLVLLTGFLLFGAVRMRKVAKEDPEREFLVQPNPNFARAKEQAAAARAPKKSIHERAMMSTDIENRPDPAPEVVDSPDYGEVVEEVEVVDAPEAAEEAAADLPEAEEVIEEVQETADESEIQ